MNLDNVINETEKRNGGPQIIKQNDDMNSIKANPFDSLQVWDAAEFGMTREQAIEEIKNDPVQMGRLKEAAIKRANLNQADDGSISMFVSADLQDAWWHELGKCISHAANSQQAIELANMGFIAKKVPLMVPANYDANTDETKVGKSYPHNPYEKMIHSGAYAVVREDNGHNLTQGKSVGGRYTVLQYSEVFEIMDEIVGQGGAKFHSAGVLGGGERAWMLAELPEEFEAAEGDNIKLFLLGVGSHDGTGATKFMLTSERVVCANTLRQALNGKDCISFRHTKNQKARAKQAAKALLMAKVGIERLQAKVARAVDVTVDQTQAEDYFALCLDDIVETTVADQRVTAASLTDGSLLSSILEITDLEERQTEEKRLDRCKNRRAKLLKDIIERYESDRNNGMVSIRDTGWSAYNAVSEFADHSPLNTYKGDRKAEKRFDSVLMGRANQIKQNALELVLEMTVA
ncbi:hypothetical protein LCGC14_0249850 [marine sediment metagenome]|uniref:Uncharacterized protein n=1 Tax=marine sediment metagenome TaxID=412755 RepID=A0A0F9ULT3_9ZZZZ